MDIAKVDYYEICLDEGRPIYNDICSLEKRLFNLWVSENLLEIVKINKYEEVIPSCDLFNSLVNLGYEHINNQCHYSAKAVTILNERIKYYTGFVERDDYPNPIITHSFNSIDEKTIDLARINLISEHGFPHYYYGIEIPREIVMNYKKETLENKSMRPLLYEWYLKNN